MSKLFFLDRKGGPRRPLVPKPWGFSERSSRPRSPLGRRRRCGSRRRRHGAHRPCSGPPCDHPFRLCSHLCSHRIWCLSRCRGIGRAWHWRLEGPPGRVIKAARKCKRRSPDADAWAGCKSEMRGPGGDVVAQTPPLRRPPKSRRTSNSLSTPRGSSARGRNQATLKKNKGMYAVKARSTSRPAPRKSLASKERHWRCRTCQQARASEGS